MTEDLDRLDVLAAIDRSRQDLAVDHEDCDRLHAAAMAEIERLQGERDELRAALGIAWDIIQANPSEDMCRHAVFVDECEGEDGDPCIDRSRRDRFRAALHREDGEEPR